jgi:hypothetical protein
MVAILVSLGNNYSQVSTKTDTPLDSVFQPPVAVVDSNVTLVMGRTDLHGSVLQSARSTINHCSTLQAFLSNTDTLFKLCLGRKLAHRAAIPPVLHSALPD